MILGRRGVARGTSDAASCGAVGIRFLDGPPRTADLVVVGGGVLGAATAFAAARAGLQPLIVERRPALATLTTAVAAGGFRLQLGDERDLALVSESVDVFMDFAEATRQREFDPRVRAAGYLWVTTSEEGAIRQRRIVEAQRSWGLGDVELLDRDEVRRRWPWIGPDVLQARFRGGDGIFEPRQVALGLASGSRASAVTSTGVTALDTAGDRVRGVRTEHGDVSCGAVVVAAGPFSASVARMAGIELPLRCVTRHKVVLADEPRVPRDAPMTIDDDTGTHWRPAFGGASIMFTDPATPPTEAADPVPVDPAFAFRVLDPSSPVGTPRIVPFWRDVWDAGPTWFTQAGQYALTPDGQPLIGPTPVEGLFLNSACDGRGVMRSVAAGRILVDVLTGRTEPRENPYRIDRDYVERPQMDAL